MVETYILFAIATLSLALAPGPDNIFVLTQSVAKGARYGMAIASGLISGCIVHTSVVALGFGTLVKNNDWLLYTIKAFGAVYLVYLAFKVYKSDPQLHLTSDGIKKDDLWKSYTTGVTMNLLNPKVTLFFLALLPQFVKDTGVPAWLQIYILGGLFMLVSLIVFYGIALLAGRIARFIRDSAWFEATIKWLQIVVFLGIAVAILMP